MSNAPDTLPSSPSESLDIDARIRRVIDCEAVTPVYQPLFHLNTGKVIGHEALTRVDSAFGFESTADLFDSAVASGALWDLEMLTRSRALKTPGMWPEGCLLFLNCNPEVAADPRFADLFLSSLRESGSMRASQIVIEITERAETQYMSGLASQVRRLRDAGVQIAIDDMGAGTSGLQRIMDLRPDWLKLDRELIANIDQDPFTQNLIDVLLRFTRVSGTRLVAEGIERREQISTLLELGVQYVQGYLLARPAPALTAPEKPLLGWIKSEVNRVESSRVSQHLTFLASITRDAPAIEGKLKLDRVRDVFASLPADPGAIVLRDGACIGWVDREVIHSAEAHEKGLRLVDLCRPTGPAAQATTLISEALLFLSTRPIQNLTNPIVIKREDEGWGVVSVNALLREASRLTNIADRSYAEVSGLPGRVKTDQRVASYLRQNAAGSVLFVDIREFHRYNEALGFELGDLILRILAGVLISVVEEECEDDDGFAGHLGDDRFLVIINSQQPERLAERIITEFEAASERFVSCSNASQIDGDSPPAGLRIICLAFDPSAVKACRDLHVAAKNARMQNSPSVIGRSIIYERPAMSIEPNQQARRPA